MLRRAFKNVYLLSWVLGLTIIWSSVAHSAPLHCGGVHSGVTTSAHSALLLTDYLAQAHSSKLETKFREQLEILQTPRDLQTFLENIQAKEKSISDQHWIWFLLDINLQTTLKKIQAQTDPQAKEWQDLKSFLERGSKTADTPAGYRRNMKGWMYPLLISMEPKRLLQLTADIDFIARQKMGLDALYGAEYGISVFNQTLLRVIAEVPKDIRDQAVQQLNEKFNLIDQEAEMMKMRGETLINPNLRKHRRNLEMLGHFITYPEFIKFRDQIKTADSKNAVRIVNSFYQSTYRMVGPDRGGYSFKKVIDTAELIRGDFKEVLTDNTRYLELYGSFVNGKASFRVSDVDMKPSEALFRKVTGKRFEDVQDQPFSLYFADFIQRSGKEAPKELLAFWEMYKSAETKISEMIFERPVKRESEILALLYPPIPFMENPGDPRFYNPMTIRIYRNHIELRLNDILTENSEPTVIIIQKSQDSAGLIYLEAFTNVA